MTATRSHPVARAILSLRAVDLDSPGDRPLIRGLSLTLELGDQVALIGRNGVGKSTLLSTLAGEGPAPKRGRVSRLGPITLVHQRPALADGRRVAGELGARAASSPRLAAALAEELDALGLLRLRYGAERPALAALARLGDAEGLSPGELRKLLLLGARHGGAELLLLDEPTEHLDEPGLAWLERWLPHWPGALICASHSPRLLARFDNFFIVAESGCRHLSASFDELLRELDEEQAALQRRHVARLAALDKRERHNVAVCRRRERKKKLGRLHELRRRTARARLNEKRSYAQESQARAAKIRADRMDATRRWAQATRRALRVELPLEALHTALPAPRDEALITLDGLGLELGGRSLVAGLSLSLSRERLAITGPNGAGKTTLLQTMLGERAPSSGRASRRRSAIGSIAQAATDWISDDSLVERLHDQSGASSLDELAALLLAHRFPLALAERPLASLSPGERGRAALICLFRRVPAVELLVLDEPSFSLDLVGRGALVAALRAWPGGLVVASHDREFLAAVGVDHTLALGPGLSYALDWGPAGDST